MVQVNERIRELIQLQNGNRGLLWTEEDKEEFAELIVKECANRVRFCIENDIDFIAENIEKHFGVEE